MDPLLLVVWIIAAIALAAILGLTGIAVAIDVSAARAERQSAPALIARNP